ncbi:hypothetical protein [Christiangramia lutea]|nr:hypothetical protein [Christiangramia lutea]
MDTSEMPILNSGIMMLSITFYRNEMIIEAGGLILEKRSYMVSI